MQRGSNSPSPAVRRRRLDALPLAHGVFLSSTGLWPIVHLRSFEAVTGRKRDKWLVKSMGAVLTAIGAAFIAEGVGGKRSPAIRVLGVGSTLALGGADLVYTAQNRISKVYLIDALCQAGFAAMWLRSRRAPAHGEATLTGPDRA